MASNSEARRSKRPKKRRSTKARSPRAATKDPDAITGSVTELLQKVARGINDRATVDALAQEAQSVLDAASPHAAGPLRVVIVGGGCAGLAAAWQLAKLPGYEIHIYEKSWCLGGKGASVRDAQGAILEHGLHVWLGFYENAFRMMRECYAEVGLQRWKPDARDPASRLTHGSIDEAFFAEPNVGVGGQDVARQWTAWSGFLPPEPGLPGETLDESTNPFTLASYVRRVFSLLKTLMQSVVARPDEDIPGEPRPDGRSTFDEARDLDFSFDATTSPAVIVERVTRLLRIATLTTAAALLQGITIIERLLQQVNYAPQVADSILQLMEAVAAQTRKQLRDFVGIDEKLRWKTDVIDIVLTIAVGLYRDRVLFAERGLDSINHLDYREWLRQHGATNTALGSPFLTGIYDLVFAYRGGSRDRPQLAAGVALRGALRMFFTYRGAMFWRMRSGMGDAVFAPLYKVLQLDAKEWKSRTPDRKRIKQSNVTFHFLHRLDHVSVGEEEGRIVVKGLTFKPKGDPDLLDELSKDALDESGAWPDAARKCFGRAVGTAPRDVELRMGPGAGGFDAVVFAIPVDDFVDVGLRSVQADGIELVHHLPPQWTAMREKVSTVATQVMELWINRDLEGLGWYRGPGLITAMSEPYQTWADMTHTLRAEAQWRADHNAPDPDMDKVETVAYFCGTLGDDQAEVRKKQLSDPDGMKLEDMTVGQPPAHPAVATVAGVADVQIDVVMKLMKPFWPNYDKADEWHGPGTARILHGYSRQNVWRSERYTLSLPGTIDYRISPLECTLCNATIAGDWTACGLDAGCVEAAVMSGMLAAHAIAGAPSLSKIVGYDHP